MYTLSADMSLKLTKQNLKSFLNHFLREEEKTNHSNQNIDDTKSHLNQTYVFDEQQNKIVLCHSKKQLNEAIEKRLSKAIHFSKNGKMTYNNTGKRVRQDAAMCVCTVIQLDPNYFKENSDSTKANKDLLVSSTEALREMFGKQNVLALSLHLDETNPHIHAITTPVTDDGRLCKKDFVDKESLKRFHKSIRNNMRKRGYDIDLQRKTARERLTEQEYQDLKSMIKKELLKEGKAMENQKNLQQQQPESQPQLESQPQPKPQPKSQLEPQADVPEEKAMLPKKVQQEEEEEMHRKRRIILTQLQMLEDELIKKKERKEELDSILDKDEGTDEEMLEYEKEYNSLNSQITNLSTHISMLKMNIKNLGKEVQLDERYAPRYSQPTKDFQLSM